MDGTAAVIIIGVILLSLAAEFLFSALALNISTRLFGFKYQSFKTASLTTLLSMVAALLLTVVAAFTVGPFLPEETQGIVIGGISIFVSTAVIAKLYRQTLLKSLGAAVVTCIVAGVVAAIVGLAAGSIPFGA
ncbi:MAG: hypothetical protein JWN64_671 [Parcubacteria group bacterium]|nr:hypothetical protein [Parcubacteria group bacterium]